jgi:hypothetical protein
MVTTYFDCSDNVCMEEASFGFWLMGDVQAVSAMVIGSTSYLPCIGLGQLSRVSKQTGSDICGIQDVVEAQVDG